MCHGKFAEVARRPLAWSRSVTALSDQPKLLAKAVDLGTVGEEGRKESDHFGRDFSNSMLYPMLKLRRQRRRSAHGGDGELTTALTIIHMLPRCRATSCT